VKKLACLVFILEHQYGTGIGTYRSFTLYPNSSFTVYSKKLNAFYVIMGVFPFMA